MGGVIVKTRTDHVVDPLLVANEDDQLFKALIGVLISS